MLYSLVTALCQVPQVEVLLLGDDELVDEFDHCLSHALFRHVLHVAADPRQELGHLGVGAERSRPV